MQETHKGIMDEPPTQRLRATGSSPLRLRLVNLEVVSNNRALFLTVVNKRPVSR